MAHGVGDNMSHPVDRHVGRRVAEKRVSLGHNQNALGKALGVTFQQIQKYEKGTNRISASRLWDTARFLQVEVGYFFDGLSNDAMTGLSEASVALVGQPTRHTVEISRLALRLNARQQKLTLNLIRDMIEPGDGREAA